VSISSHAKSLGLPPRQRRPDWPGAPDNYARRYAYVVVRNVAGSGLRVGSDCNACFERRSAIATANDKRPVDLGPIHATKDTTKTIPLPPVLGGLSLLGGVILIVLGAKHS
jgi:hypothetical protein